jgi:ribosomal protein L13E
LEQVEHEPVHAGRASLGNQRAGGLDVDRAGELGIPGARRIADDGRQMDDLVNTVEGLPTGRRVADVGLDQLHPARPQAG